MCVRAEQCVYCVDGAYVKYEVPLVVSVSMVCRCVLCVGCPCV